MKISLPKLHLAWAVIAVAACGLLIFSGGGHPPPVVFLPVVIVVWAGGHGALLLLGKLAVRGRAEARKAGAGSDSWPPALMVVLLATGIAALVGVVQLGGSLFLGKLYPFKGALWGMTMAVWLAHLACFAGLLLRRRWAGKCSALLATGWGLLMAVQIVGYLYRGQRISVAEIGLAAAIMSAMFVFGAYLWFSGRVSAFLSADRSADI
ncbi:MAG: hypothetical protein R3174_00665 [Gammaproteobacteria bacterium]|nr:hypothetical protein [Gammaproteobacteria bacterium]